MPVGVFAVALLAVSWVPLTNLYAPAGERNRSGVPDEAAPAGLPRTAPRILVQPFQNVGEPQYLSLAFGVTEEVMSRLARYPDLEIHVEGSQYFGGSEASAQRSDTGNVDYVLTGSVRNTASTIRVSPRLLDARSGRQIWTVTFEQDFDVNTVWTILDSIAGSVATTVGEPYGPVFDAEVARVQGADVENIDAYHCVLRFLFALQVLSEDAHGRATACFEHVVATEPASSTSWARLATLYRMEYLHDFNPKPDAAPPLERALDAARRALDSDFDDAFAHQEMAFLCLLREDPVCFEEEIARTLALDPTADVRAAIGVNFVKMGETERGFALIEQGRAESPRAPPFFFLGYVVYSLRMRDLEAAFAWAERMEAPEWPLSQAVLAAVAALTERPERARHAAERLLELRPDFATNGRGLIARGKLGVEVESLLVEGLARAGVELE